MGKQCNKVTVEIGAANAEMEINSALWGFIFQAERQGQRRIHISATTDKLVFKLHGASKTMKEGSA